MIQVARYVGGKLHTPLYEGRKLRDRLRALRECLGTRIIPRSRKGGDGAIIVLGVQEGWQSLPEAADT